jgi:hypothetical protein
LVKSIIETERIREINDLNLSYNALNKYREEKDFLNFIDLTKEFLSSSKAMTHLDLSGMQIGEHVIELMPVIYTSALRVIHLNNNAITKDNKRFIFNTLNQDFSQSKKAVEIK